MGSNLREILDNVSYPEIFLSFPNAKEKKRIESKEKAILEFYQQFACVGGDLVFSQSPYARNYKGRIGRRNMNRRLNLDIPQNNTFLLPRDVLAATDHLIGMKFGTGILDDDDMNHLKNKRIRSVADLLQDQFGLALGRLQHAVQKTIRRVFIRQSKPTPQTLVTPTSTSILLITTYETFFGTYPLSQVFDQTNPLTQTVHG
uniref:DNA-directed RNA polymerase n=1 Tax=Aegilops tauschii subsp. strangulata TaxID=200361 RepID=A0A452YM85_AEGTS